MCRSSTALSRVALCGGLLALALVLAAFAGGCWLWAWEPLQDPPRGSVLFRIGLWRACPSVWLDNGSQPVATPACTTIRYTSWDEVKHSDLGIWSPLHFTPAFISRMRLSMPFEAAGVVLIMVASLFSVLGHFSGDHKMLVACGLFILGGLALGGGLVIFASVLSDAYMERPKHHMAFDYRYGWSFFVACGAFLTAELAALLSVSAYLRRFPSVEEMVSVVVPGAERLVRGLWAETKWPLLLSSAAPDVCSSNPTATAKEETDASSSLPQTDAGAKPLVVADYDVPVAAVTVPIKLMGQQPKKLAPVPAAEDGGVPMPTPFLFAQQLQQGGVHNGRYATLKPPPKKKAVNVSTFSSLEQYDTPRGWSSAEAWQARA